MKYAVIGLGKFGTTLAKALARGGAEVVAVDNNLDLVDEAKDEVTLAVKLDATDEKELLAQGIHKVDVAIVSIGENFEANQLATVILKKLGVKKVITRATSTVRSKILALIGADEVISPEEETAMRLAQRLLVPNIVDYLELSEGYSVVELKAPEKFHGKTIKELDIRNKYDINLIAIKRILPVGKPSEGKTKIVLNAVPRPNDVIEPSDILIVVGDDKSIEELLREE
ncbi:MAG: TrkA family potassium uptake protein [Planctomycetes bacterium]|nr:TrkA family potassium uptake protein [Planctomycetota bacterium]